MSTTLHGHSPRSDSTARKLSPRGTVDARDLQLKVKAASSSSLVGSKGQGDSEPRQAFVDVPHVVTALDVFKVNTLLLSVIIIHVFYRC